MADPYGGSDYDLAQKHRDGSFPLDRWQAMWEAQSDELRQLVRDKAQVEQASLSSVVRGWWPELWAQVAVPADTRRNQK